MEAPLFAMRAVLELHAWIKSFKPVFVELFGPCVCVAEVHT